MMKAILKLLIPLFLSLLAISCGVSNPSGTSGINATAPTSSVPSGLLSVASPSATLLPPASITVTNPNPFTINISWSPVASASGYNVYRSYELSPNVYAKIAAKLPAASTSFKEVVGYKAGKYYFAVTAIDATGKESPNPKDTAIYIAGFPQSVNVAAGNGHNTISWSPVTGATSYVLYYSSVAAVYKSIRIGSTSQTSYIHNASNGTTYYYAVATVSAKGESSNSYPGMPGTPAATAIDPPAGVVAGYGNPAYSSQVISWTPVASATYNVYRSLSPNVALSVANKITASPIAAASYTSTGLLPNTRYYYKVTALVGGIGSGGSAEVSKATIPSAPASISVAPQNRQNTISWTPVPGAVSYNLYFSTTQTVVSKANSTKITNVTRPYTHTGLTNGTKYYYAVDVVTANGMSYNSVTTSGAPLLLPGLNPPPKAAPGGLANNWTNLTPTYQSIASNNRISVVVGEAGNIKTSTDSITWIARMSGTANNLNSITWSTQTGQFVVVGQRGIILTSPDGITWTQRVSGTVLGLIGVIWSGTQFISVGDSGIILTSYDGITWTSRMSGTVNNLRNIIWGGMQFVVIGWGGTVLTSPDGIIWTSHISDPTILLDGIAWSGTQFIAVGNSGVILTSPDGITWIRRTSGTTNPIYSISWNGAQFVAVGWAGLILTSPDGTVWTPRTAGIANNLQNIIWSGTQFLTVGWSGIILTSPDGITWTSRIPGSPNLLTGVTSDGKLFVVIGYSGTILTSPDGNSWTSRISGTTLPLCDIVWSGTQFVVVGDGGAILTSPDGITWTSRVLGTTKWLRNIVWSGTQFVAVGQSYTGGESPILTSPDGITWTSRVSGTTHELMNVAWSGTQFVIVGLMSTILTSPDGIIWTPRTPAIVDGLWSIVWDGTKFVTIGNSGIVQTSPDGVVWTVRSTTSMMSPNSIIWSGTQFVSVGSGNSQIYTSPDSIVWTMRIAQLSNPLYDVSWNGTRFVAVGALGAILVSQ